jgi:heat-inducible transcriptional repressor
MTEIAFPGGVRSADPELTERQRRIFLALLRLHCRTAQAVSSDAVSRLPGIPWSPAGIRSTLADLEAMGLLQRGHAAGGRLPTAAGFAFHVRHDLTPAPLSAELVREVDERLRQASRDVEALLAEASRVISRFTRQLGLAVSTALEGERLAAFELAPLGPRRTLMVLSLGGGAVHTMVLELENALEREELDEAAEVLRTHLVGLTLGEVRERLGSDPALVDDTAVRIVARAAAASWGEGGTTLFSAGAGQFATQPEFSDREKLGSLLRVLETGPPLDRLMVETAEGQAAVRVALDQDRALQGLSLVTFSLPGRRRGAVGVLGPMRMDYAHGVAVVDLVGGRVAEYLEISRRRGTTEDA